MAVMQHGNRGHNGGIGNTILGTDLIFCIYSSVFLSNKFLVYLLNLNDTASYLAYRLVLCVIFVFEMLPIFGIVLYQLG